MKLSIYVITMFVCISAVFALGVSPVSREQWSIGIINDSFNLVDNEGNRPTVNLRVEGDLADYVKLDTKRVSLEEFITSIGYYLELPSLSPGVYSTKIIAVEDASSNGIVGRFEIPFTLKVKVPESGSFLSGVVDVRSRPEMIDVVTVIENSGDKPVLGLTSIVHFFDSEDVLVFSTHKVSDNVIVPSVQNFVMNTQSSDRVVSSPNVIFDVPAASSIEVVDSVRREASPNGVFSAKVVVDGFIFSSDEFVVGEREISANPSHQIVNGVFSVSVFHNWNRAWSGVLQVFEGEELVGFTELNLGRYESKQVNVDISSKSSSLKFVIFDEEKVYEEQVVNVSYVEQRFPFNNFLIFVLGLIFVLVVVLKWLRKY